MTKKFTVIILSILFAVFAFAADVSAQDQAAVYFFWGHGCPHCTHQKPFLEKLADKYPGLTIYDYEVWSDSANRDLMVQVGQRLNANIAGVPFTVVGEQYFSGWLSEETTGAAIEKAVQCALKDGCRDVVGEILASTKPAGPPKKPCDCETEDEPVPQMPGILDLPIVGRIDPRDYSLPLLTIILGGLDGFNPCAMWTLLFLISLLMGMKDKKRRWILGTAFIIASALVYFIFMAAWLNFLLLIGFITWVRIIIALIAIGGGSYNLREFFVNKDNTCKVTGGEKRRAVFERLKQIAHTRQFALALVGIILLAFAVNLVELICSAGLPVIFTQILVLSDLETWQYYAYMLLYIFVFMLDDLIVFYTAMITLEVTGISSKYARFSHLIGGALMVIIGLLLIFKPELLMFG